MTNPCSPFCSTLGRKIIMAVTGVMLVGFVLGHMAGNLQIFLPHGDESLKQYAEFLQSFGHGFGIWGARGGLLVALALHLWAAFSLIKLNRAARPVGYAEVASDASSYASRTMRWGGPIILLFVIYHLLHFTTGQAHGEFIQGDPYHNVVAGFQHRGAAAFYILAMVALGLHLYHGTWSMLQTLGLNHPRYNAARKGLASLLAAVVTIGNCSIPIAVQAGLLKLAH